MHRVVPCHSDYIEKLLHTHWRLPLYKCADVRVEGLPRQAEFLHNHWTASLNSAAAPPLQFGSGWAPTDPYSSGD